MKVVFFYEVLALLASGSPTSQPVNASPASVVPGSNALQIPDSYIVVFGKHLTADEIDSHYGWLQVQHHSGRWAAKTELKRSSPDAQKLVGGQKFDGLKHTFNIAGSVVGYSGHFNEETIEQIRRHPVVDHIEKDQEVRTLALSDEPELERNAPWGLARISHRDALRLSTYNKYLYAAEGGDGVDVYVIDTGTNVEHADFEDRASWGKVVPADEAEEDTNGHGTHCSGIVAGKKYGVAKKASIKAVKVLRSNGSGRLSDVIKGVEYAVEQHTAAKSNRKNFKGSVANMSLGGGKSRILDDAVNAAVRAGLHFAVAAGNDNADSCNYSPAAAEEAVTVGASTLVDERAYFSNYGKCTDIFAPGLEIESAWIGGRHASYVASGTSMASPHVAGLLAYLLSLRPSSNSAYAIDGILTPKKLKADLLVMATRGALTDLPKDTSNVLAWNGGGQRNYSAMVRPHDLAV